MFKTDNEAGSRAGLENTTPASSAASAGDDPTALQRAVQDGRLVTFASVSDDNMVLPNGLTLEQNRRLDAVMQRDGGEGCGHLDDRRTALRSQAVDDNAVMALQQQAAAPVHKVPDCDLDAKREQKPQFCRAQLV